MKIMIAADGPVFSPKTNSGVALGLYRALQRRRDVEVVQTADGQFRGWRRFMLAAATIRPSRRWWWATLNLGVLNIAWRSLRRDRVARLTGEVDFILQVRNIYLPSRLPYAVFIDSTSHMANSGWKVWRPSPLSRWCRFRIERWQFARAAHVFTAGAHAAKSVVDEYHISPEKVTSVGGGVNYDPLPPREVRSLPAAPHILWVGLDYERKGGDLLLEAFTRLRASFPAATLTMVGQDARAEIAGVEFLGKIDDRERLAELYAQASVFCLPARHEPYGLVVQEAMAFSLPCIVSRVGALDHIVDDGETGLVVDQDSCDALTHALVELATSPEIAREMGLKGRDKVEHSLTWDRVADRMISAIAVDGRTI